MQKNLFLQIISSILTQDMYMQCQKETSVLKRLPELTNEMVCVLKNMETMTITYKLSVTNLKFIGSVTRKPKRYTGKKD